MVFVASGQALNDYAKQIIVNEYKRSNGKIDEFRKLVFD